VKALGQALQDRSVQVRRAAVRALSEIESRESTPFLVAALKDADAEVRRHAAEALGDRK
jgi:HEAT repeat protein